MDLGSSSNLPPADEEVGAVTVAVGVARTPEDGCGDDVTGFLLKSRLGGDTEGVLVAMEGGGATDVASN